MKIREGVQFQDGEPCTAHSIKQNTDEMQRWAAPHPSGTWLIPKKSNAEAVDAQTIRFRVPGKEGLPLGKNAGLSDRK